MEARHLLRHWSRPSIWHVIWGPACSSCTWWSRGGNGAGLGAGHQTGWTGGIALLQHLFATSTPEQYLEIGRHANVVEVGAAPTHIARAAAFGLADS